MRLIPHGFTILVDPDPPPDRTDSGLILMPEEHDHVATSGTVVAVGKGSKREWDIRRKAYERVKACFPRSMSPETADAFLLVLKLANAPEPAPSVCVGDRVVFGPESGLTVTDDGKSYLLLEEDHVAIIVEEESEVA